MSVIDCPACGIENRANSKFCLECGSRFALSCPQCSAELPPATKFCNECGAEIRGLAVRVVGVRGTPDPQLPGTPLTANTQHPNTLAYTPKHLADKILHSKAALEGERKQVTVLFADVKGSMELAEQVDAEEWHRILDRFFHILSD